MVVTHSDAVLELKDQSSIVYSWSSISKINGSGSIWADTINHKHLPSRVATFELLFGNRRLLIWFRHGTARTDTKRAGTRFIVRDSMLHAHIARWWASRINLNNKWISVQSLVRIFLSNKRRVTYYHHSHAECYVSEIHRREKQQR